MKNILMLFAVQFLTLVAIGEGGANKQPSWVKIAEIQAKEEAALLEVKRGPVPEKLPTKEELAAIVKGPYGEKHDPQEDHAHLIWRHRYEHEMNLRRLQKKLSMNVYDAKPDEIRAVSFQVLTNLYVRTSESQNGDIWKFCGIKDYPGILGNCDVVYGMADYIYSLLTPTNNFAVEMAEAERLDAKYQAEHPGAAKVDAKQNYYRCVVKYDKIRKKNWHTDGHVRQPMLWCLSGMVRQCQKGMSEEESSLFESNVVFRAGMSAEERDEYFLLK